MKCLILIVILTFVSTKGEEILATCRMARNPNPADTGDNVEGMIYLTQDDSGLTKIELDLSGFDTTDDVTTHGFHVHEFGDLVDGCESFGSHYNPLGSDHGAPDNTVYTRHVGDLGNIEEDANGNVKTTITDFMVSLYGKFSVIGRGMIVHEKVDDLGKGGSDDSLTTGNAGSRLSCCVIGWSDGEDWPQK